MKGIRWLFIYFWYLQFTGKPMIPRQIDTVLHLVDSTPCHKDLHLAAHVLGTISRLLWTEDLKLIALPTFGCSRLSTFFYIAYVS